jgi:hypothetical protein
MARVTQQKSARQNGNSNNNRGAQIAKQRNNKKQNVVVENNAPGAKGLNNVVSKSGPKNEPLGKIPSPKRHTHDAHQLSIHTEPPPGYTFIPVGNPQLTTALKDFAKRGNHKIFSVSVSSLHLRVLLLTFGRRHHMLHAMSSPVKFTAWVFISLQQ